MIDQIFEKFDGAFAENTIRAYRSDFEQYSKWCANKSIPPISATADNLAMYVDELSQTRKSATIRRRVNSLGTILRLSKNLDVTKDPEVILALKRMHRKLGRYQKQAEPLTQILLQELAEGCPENSQGLRDKVLLLLGHETLRRRSELCNFKFEDLTSGPCGKHAIRLKKSKTDQEGLSKLIPISTRLHDLITKWQAHSLTNGFILRSVDKHGNIGNHLHPGSVGIILNRLFRRSRLRGAEYNFSGHSLRVGGALDLLRSGASIEMIMLRGGWRSEDTAMSYLRSW